MKPKFFVVFNKINKNKKMIIDLFSHQNISILNKREGSAFTASVVTMFHKMIERCLVPHISVVVNTNSKNWFFLHQFFRPGMVLSAVILPATSDQTTRLRRAIFANAFAVSAFSYSRGVVGFSPRTLGIHAEIIVNFRIEPPRVAVATNQILSFPEAKAFRVPSIKVGLFKRNKSQLICLCIHKKKSWWRSKRSKHMNYLRWMLWSPN